MTDAERKAAEATAFLEAAKPYLKEIEEREFEMLIATNDPNEVLEHRLQIVAIRKLKDSLKRVVTRGQMSLQNTPTVA
jgi:phosphoglycolate phosphatase-like HAD superfamily hydrolase